jgi:serine/threonine protein kinase/class 3 adenylate cyclase
MELGAYRLLAHQGAGKDGVSYQGRDAHDQLVEIRLLTGIHLNEPRGKTLARKLRQAVLLEHPTAQAIRDLSLDHDPPYVVLEGVEGTSLGQAFHTRVPLPAMEVVGIGQVLAEVLVAAHRLGLVHGRLCPAMIRCTAAGGLKIDFTGIDVGPAPEPSPVPEVDASCGSLPPADETRFDTAIDLFSLGAILFWLLRGRPVSGISLQPESEESPHLQQLLARLLAPDPAERPSSQIILDQLATMSDRNGTDTGAAAIDTSSKSQVMMDATTQWTGPRQAVAQPAVAPGLPAWVREQPPTRLGRFHLLEKLGAGGLGAVYKAQDMAAGTVVAIKILQPRGEHLEQALQRLRKEARLLAEVNNPYVANLIEMNEDQGIPYLVMEYVHGQSLATFLAERHQLEERLAVSIMADVARALVDAHQRGILHRDIKPENILLVSEDEEPGPLSVALGETQTYSLRPPTTQPPNPLTTRPPKVKLCDFGLARHVQQSASLNLTGDGTGVGTPYYTSPEQCHGEFVDPRTDVYALGATLFHLLAGRPPFVGDTVLALSLQHAKEPPPPLQRYNPAVSEGVCRIVEKALAKDPASRYDDAEAMLADLERVLRGEPTHIVIHPLLPSCDPAKVLQYDWAWDLEAAPEQLWPHISNTERLNRAVGIPAVQYTAEPDPAGGTRRFGKFRKAGLTVAWREHPFEWIEGQRLSVLREYSEGVFEWLATVTDLQPRGSGTRLTHQVRIEPRGLLGRLVAAMEVGVKGRRAVERVYRRIDAFVMGKLDPAAATDPFEKPTGLAATGRRRLEQVLDRLIACQVKPEVVERLGEFMRQAPPQEVARIRPFALAQRLKLDPDQVVTACLHGAREGLFILLWDILCPVCRIPSAIQDTLRALSEHNHCPACNLDFPVDFANSVEMIFRVHPEIRRSELATYCIGGPAHSPHVAAQVRVKPGERIELDLGLTEGVYRLRGPQLPYALDLRVQTTAALTRWDLHLARGPEPAPPPALRTGRQKLILANDQDHELLVRVERTAPRADALTAARASALALFRELFPGEVLSPGQLISVASTTLLVTDLDQADLLYQQLGDARTVGLLHGYFRLLDECVRREGGALVKTVGEGAMAAFTEPAAAVRAGLDLLAQVAREMAGQSGEVDLGSRLRVGIHCGPVLAATINDHLDYYGATVRQTARLPGFIRGGEMILTQSVAGHPQVAAWLRTRGLAMEVLPENLTGQPDGILHRLVHRTPKLTSS